MESSKINDPRRKVLKEAVCLLVSEAGFTVATEECIESLVEMLQSRKFLFCLHFPNFDSMQISISVLCETANQSKNFAELAGRTQPVVGDVVMAMVNMGISFKDLDVSDRMDCRIALQILLLLQKYAVREGRPTARNLNPSKAQNPLQILQAGSKPSYPVHIPSYLPALPDPHAYVRTATYKQPETEYEAIREKSANQKRDVEKALTRFLAKTSELGVELVQAVFDLLAFQVPRLTACSTTKKAKCFRVSLLRFNL